MGALKVVHGAAPSHKLSSPFVVCLWLADVCNISCRYCYAMPFSGKVMNTQRMLDLCRELVDLNVFDITLAGGEPFMNPGVFDAIDTLLTAGTNVGVLSNGALFDRDMRENLVRTVDGRENFLLQISLDGACAETHDKSRQQGQQIIDNLNDLCTQTDLRLQIATVINAYNIAEIPDIINTYYPRVKRFHFMNLQRTERSLRHEDLFVGQERNEKFWSDMERYMESMPGDILITGLNLMRQLHRMHKDPDAHRQNSCFDCSSCTSGVTHVEITTDFKVLGCDIAKDFTLMGDISDKSFAEVWNSEQAERVRRYPYPACFLVQSPGGDSLADQLKPEVAAYYEQVIAPGLN